MSIIDRLSSDLSVVDQLRQMAIYEEPSPIGRKLAIKLTDISKGHSIVSGTPGSDVCNPFGTVHGGYISTMLDTACAYATHSMLSPSQGYATLELKVSFHKAVSQGAGELRAEGEVISLGRRVAFASAAVKDADGKLYASATSTLLVFER